MSSRRSFRKLSLFAILLLSACGQRHEAPEPLISSLPIVEQRVQPADTGSGIDFESLARFHHHVVLPRLAQHRKDILLVHLVGSAVAPESALDISRFAASLGYAVLNLRYPNGTVVNLSCGDRSACPEQLRGETVFGENVPYAAGLRSYDEPSRIINRQNSVVNRVLNLLDFLANQPASANNPDPNFWSQFLKSDANSPYFASYRGNAYPDWSKIVVSGHSQGAGMVALLAMNLPNQSPARRVIMFAGPNDTTGDADDNQPSAWLLRNSATPMQRFWGLRHTEDQELGAWIKQNWQVMGGPSAGGVGGPGQNDEFDIGDGSVYPAGAQRLLLTRRTLSSADAHASTVDRSLMPQVTRAWLYLFTADGRD